MCCRIRNSYVWLQRLIPCSTPTLDSQPTSLSHSKLFRLFMVTWLTSDSDPADSISDPAAAVIGRVVLDSWVVSQIWLDSDSNESSQSRVGRENQGYESSQSRVTLIVIWVRVESTGYCLSQSWVNDFSRRKLQDLAISITLQRKNQHTVTSDRTPPPPVNNFFPKLGKMWWVFWVRFDSTLTQMSWVRVESG